MDTRSDVYTDDINKVATLLDRISFYDNENCYRKVGYMQNGRLILFEDPPRWLVRIKERYYGL